MPIRLMTSDLNFWPPATKLCANVLIYFRPSLQERAHRLFYGSLVRSGYLALGQKESLVFCPESSRYQRLRDGVNLFHKVR